MAEVVKKFDEANVDENGNIITTGGVEGPNEGKAHANVVREFEDTIENPDGSLRAIAKPDVKVYED